LRSLASPFGSNVRNRAESKLNGAYCRVEPFQPLVFIPRGESASENRINRQARKEVHTEQCVGQAASLSRERREYILAGLTAASLLPKSLENDVVRP
jgi:hypothetical protein